MKALASCQMSQSKPCMALQAYVRACMSEVEGEGDILTNI